MKFLIGIVALLILVLAGCSLQTTVKFQCTDGSFVDSANQCSSKTCPETNCPKLDCTSCPPKIEYQTKEIEKKVYVDKLKVECLDGTIKDKKEECANIQEITKNMPIKDNTDICRDTSNKNLERIELITDSMRRNEDAILGTILETKTKWYPSLNEGWVEMYFLKIKNTGCTIIEREKISLTIKVYDGDKIIYSKEKDKDGFSYFYAGADGQPMGNRKIYPQDEDTIRTPFNLKNTGWPYEAEYKFNKEGKYPVKFILYYGDDIIAQTEDVVNIS